jgi:flagellar FliL protein
MAKAASSPDKPASASTENVAPRSRSSFGVRLLVIFLVLSVVIIECAVAYLCLPSSTETSAVAAVVTKASPKKPEPEEPKVEENETAGNVEVDMGEFSVTAFQPASNTTLRIDFHLYGSVGAESEKEFRRLYEENKHRVREQVLVTVRSADMQDLTDASLGLIKRTILDKARRTLGKPLLREVIVSDYSFIEQ